MLKNSHTLDGGAVICSGLLATEVGEVETEVASLGWRAVEQIDENEWRALRLRVER